MIGAILGILILEAVGAAVLTLLCADLKRLSLTAKLGLSFALGMVALSVALFVASWCGLKPALWMGLALTLVAWFAAAIWKRERLLDWRAPAAVGASHFLPKWTRLFCIVLAVFIIGICATVGAVSLSEPLVEWDVIAIWGLKAKVLFAEPVSQSPYFTDVGKAFSHADYPVLFPMTMAWLWACAGTADWQAIKILSVAILCAYAATQYGLLRRKHDRAGALLFTAILVGLPFWLSQIARLSSDTVLSFFAMSAFVSLYFWLDEGHGDDLRLAGFLAAGILFTKKEGIGLFGIFIVVGLGALLLRKQFALLPRVAGWLVGAPVLLTGAWFIFSKLKVTKVPELTDVSGKLGLGHLFSQLHHVPDIVRGALAKFTASEDWLFFWILFFAALAVSAKRWIKPPLLFLALGALLPLLMYGYIFTILATPPDQSLSVDFLMEYTANRVLLHGAGLCVFLMAESARAARLLPWMCGTKE